MKVIFSHGKESGPWGSKITAMADLAKAKGFDVDSIDYSDTMDADLRVDRLKSILQNENESQVILVGSSMGGYVSMAAANSFSVAGVFVLAPALYIPGWKEQSYSPKTNIVEIIHGWSDEIVPHELSIRYARESQTTLHLIDGDHRLNSSITEVLILFSNFLTRIKS